MSKAPTPSNRPVPPASLDPALDPISGLVAARREGEREGERESGREETMTFDEALAQLEEIIEKMERRDAGLEESLAGYEASVKLIKRCRDVLRNAESRVEELNKLLEEGGQSEPGEAPDNAQDSDDASEPLGNR